MPLQLFLILTSFIRGWVRVRGVVGVEGLEEILDWFQEIIPTQSGLHPKCKHKRKCFQNGYLTPLGLIVSSISGHGGNVGRFWKEICDK